MNCKSNIRKKLELMNKDMHNLMRMAYIREEMGSQCGNWDEQVTIGKVST